MIISVCSNRLPIVALSFLLLIQVTPIAKSNGGAQNRPVPHKQHCIVGTYPSPPDPIKIDDIIVFDFVIDSGNTLYLNFSWALPEATYGQITTYQARVLHMPVDAQRNTPSSNIITEQVFTSVSCSRYSTAGYSSIAA